MNPAQVTVVRAKFSLPSTASGPQKYVHHCHIVEHEDNDMMERFIVSKAMPHARPPAPRPTPFYVDGTQTAE